MTYKELDKLIDALLLRIQERLEHNKDSYDKCTLTEYKLEELRDLLWLLK